MRAQGSAARCFEFAARRWVDDGSPITGVLLIEDSVYWIAVLGLAAASPRNQGEIGLDWGAEAEGEGAVSWACVGCKISSGECEVGQALF